MSGKAESGDSNAVQEALSDLGEQVAVLRARVDALEALVKDETPRPTAPVRRRVGRKTTLELVVRPVPEIAMAAVAETAIRRADGVHSISDSQPEEGGKAARYLVELDEEADLVKGLEKTLPVPFSATEPEPGKFLFELEW